MDKNATSAPPNETDAQPPPYSPPLTDQLPVGPLGPTSRAHIYDPQAPPFNYTHQEVFRPAHIVTHQPGRTIHIITNSSLFGPNPRTLICPTCNITVTSRTVHEPSMRAHILACTLCIFGCWPCAPCVYCVEPCLNVNHYCPHCNSWQGVYVPM